MSIKIIVLSLIACAASTSIEVAAAAPQAFETYSIGDVRFSADADRIAYTLCSTTVEGAQGRVKRCNLFVAPQETWKDGSPGSFLATNVEGFAWSPDSRSLAMLRKCEATTCVSVTDGVEVHELGAVAGPVLEWLDSKTIVVVQALAETATGEAPHDLGSSGEVSIVHGGVDRARSLNAAHASLILITIPDGARTVLEHDLSLYERRPFIAISPDRQSIAYTAPRQTQGGDFIETDIKLWRRGSEPRVIARRQMQRSLNGELIWSPDGARIAWCAGATRDPNRSDEVVIYDLGRAMPVVPELPASIMACPGRRPDAEDLPDLAWAGNDHLLVAADQYNRSNTTDRRSTAIYRLDLAGGKPEKLYSGDRDEEVFMLRAGAETAAREPFLDLLIRHADGASASVVRWGRNGRGPTLAEDVPGGIVNLLVRLSEKNDKIAYPESVLDRMPSIVIRAGPEYVPHHIAVAPRAAGPIPSIKWLHYSIEGRPRSAALILPAAITPQTRLIIAIYPTLTTSDLLDFADAWPFPNVSYWLRRGDAVLYPDMRVRTPRARADIVADVASAMRAFTAAKRKMGIEPCAYFAFGHSAGALAIYDVITSDIALDGAVATGDFSNWDAFFGDTHSGLRVRPYGSGLAQWSSIGPGGTPWTNPDGYRDASPFYDFDKVRTPLLIGHGTADMLDVYHAEAAFISLESLGKDVTLVLADGGGHVPSDWSTEQRTAFLQQVEQFVAAHAGQRCRSAQ